MYPRLIAAWLLVVVFLVVSCAAPAFSSRPLAADGDATRELVAGGGAAMVGRRVPRSLRNRAQNKRLGTTAWLASASGRVPRGGSGGHDRRLLGTRTTWPPAPVPGRSTGMGSPPPPPFL
ncbi:hypothetical protein ACP70R_041737 [Stipagrostis hirtigluma subsp. patula]